jgi:hypothetical protein
MRRRLRRPREIPFSFDSFLDIVANVVGIIIRLILVAWVGARSYSSVKQIAARPRDPESQASVAAPEFKDPLAEELARHRQELAQAQARLLEQLRRWQEAKDARGQAEKRLAALVERHRGLAPQQSSLQKQIAEGAQHARTVALSLEQLRDRQKHLLEAIHELEQMPVPTKVLRYRTPVSRPVQADEFMFECREDRVTFFDIAALQGEIHRALQEKGELLRTRWQVSDVTPAVGAFRLRYTLERQRGLLDAVIPGAGPESGGSYRYGLSEWIAEPIAPRRGETEAEALAPGSDFRRLVDTLDPQQSAVTFWVYPDSFGLYRRLRDYLYQRDLVVAGRPLPPEAPIACSRSGTLSRGQ